MIYMPIKPGLRFAPVGAEPTSTGCRAPYDDHAHLGADLAREILGELKLTDEAETDMICSAIYHHDDKLVTDNPMDEVLKDADVFDHCLKDPSKPVKEKEQARYDKLCAEFGMR